ncbi:MAG: hypothetical protein IKH93_01665 [Bacteroidales bacterium]|nr:hypothetical protein [Bacteroidales bacterium]
MSLSKIESALGALVLLLSVLVFPSCIETNYTLGDVLVPTSNNLYVESVSLDLKVGMKSSADIQSSSYYYDVGTIVSEEFGLTKVDLAATVTPSDTGIHFGTDPYLIDAYIMLKLDNVQTFADNQDNITQNLYVYPMSRAMDSTMVTCTSVKEDDYIHTPIGTALLTSRDTVIIPLDREWALKLMASTRAELDSMELFIKNHYGIYMTTDDPIEGSIGGRLNNFLSASIKMGISSVNKRNIRRDTTITFDIGSLYNGVATQVFKHSTKDLEIGPDNNEKVLYYEGLAGIKPFIDASILRETIETWADENDIDLDKIMITRASFDLPFEFPEDYRAVDYYYPQGLYPAVYTLDSVDHVKRYNLLGSIYDETYNNGDINRSLYCYRPDVTYYIHQLIHKDEVSEKDDIWLIAPFEYVQTSSSNNNSYYNPYMYNSYYNPYYGGYGYGGYGYGYGGYGYGGYGGYGRYGYNNYYNNMYYYDALYNAASTSSETFYYVDYMNYAIGQINGNGAERHPKLHLTYVLLGD